MLPTLLSALFATTISLPGRGTYSTSTNRVWVPAGNTGNVASSTSRQERSRRLVASQQRPRANLAVPVWVRRVRATTKPTAIARRADRRADTIVTRTIDRTRFD